MFGAVIFSQFPAFSQDYKQRLGLSVDELSLQLAQFDRQAATLGFSREQALATLATRTPSSSLKAASLRDASKRHMRLSNDLTALNQLGPFSRLAQLGHMSNYTVLTHTWARFSLVVPVTFEAMTFAVCGFLGVGLLALLALGLTAVLFRPDVKK